MDRPMSPTDEMHLHARWAAEDERDMAMCRPAQHAQLQRIRQADADRHARRQHSGYLRDGTTRFGWHFLVPEPGAERS